MKIAGIIAEYNPFHNGHAYHIAETRRITGCDAVVAVMAGHFTQRGEAACLDKWTRTQMALSCGADAVFELPALFAVRTADAFAAGGVGILSGLGADYLSFGCESELLPYLDALTELSFHEPESVRADIRDGLNAGKSHARARGEAYARFLSVSPELLNAPNAALAVEYRKALLRLDSPVRPAAVPRSGEYHSDTLSGFASASAIRNAIRRGDPAAESCVPESIRPLLRNACRDHAPDDLLLYTLRGMSADELSRLPDVPEGLEMRLQRIAAEACSAEALIEAVKCRRYTRARIARLLAHALIGMDSSLTQAHPAPEYARLLGMRKDAAPLLHVLSERSRLPIVSDPAALRPDPVFALECRATDLWALTRDLPEERASGQEFTRKFVSV